MIDELMTDDGMNVPVYILIMRMLKKFVSRSPLSPALCQIAWHEIWQRNTSIMT